jgi:ribosomal protein S18 acetylase RimI-like enzyme
MCKAFKEKDKSKDKRLLYFFQKRNKSAFREENIVNYRKGTMSDIIAISQLVEAAKVDMDNKGIYQWDNIYPTVDDFQHDISNNNLYVVEDEKCLVAIYVISEEYDEAYTKCTWENADETACVLHRFCVTPEYQNRGLGKQILSYIESQAKEMSYESIRLDAFTENPHALNLYRNSGYQHRGFADWRKGRFMLMEKKIWNEV